MSEVRSFPNRWQTLALVCRKCSKKLGGGFGRKGKHDLFEVVQETLRDTGRRRAVLMAKVGCLGLCPKNAVTVALADRLLTVPAGTGGAEVVAAFNVSPTTG